MEIIECCKFCKRPITKQTYRYKKPVGKRRASMLKIHGFCDRRCQEKYNNNMVYKEWKCLNCDNTINNRDSSPYKKYCSKPCQWKYYREHSEKANQYIKAYREEYSQRDYVKQKKRDYMKRYKNDPKNKEKIKRWAKTYRERKKLKNENNNRKDRN